MRPPFWLSRDPEDKQIRRRIASIGLIGLPLYVAWWGVVTALASSWVETALLLLFFVIYIPLVSYTVTRDDTRRP